ncbi:MAG TPA: YggS family pyridoxal phosphate-dependent enzyme [Blastocatellia bacterium]|nr:YggS family pyridoxal phosphate-dependent enzyme [Blastocatellia bacterium]
MAETIQDNLARVHAAIAQAARRAGRQPEEVQLIAVSKTFDAATVQRAVDAGARDLGENRVQEAAGKVGTVHGEGLRWHLIGHLQANKARLAVNTFDVIHTIDRLELAERLDRICGEEQRHLDVLVQVDLGHEATKSGADESDLPAIIEALDGARFLSLKGLMTLPPLFEDVEQVRPFFRRLRDIRDRLNEQRGADRRLTELSMGMSHDFQVAIEEGATMVRVGTAVFGRRTKL